MPWFYVDDAFADSKPVMNLDSRLRNEAVGLWVRCGAWSAKEETDGRVPLDTVKSFGGTPRLITALHIQARLWGSENPEISAESWRDSREILFKSWEKWQKTRAENIAKRKADAIRQAEFRRTKKGRGYVSNSELASDDTELSRCDTDRDNPDDADDSANSCHGVSHSAPTQTRPDPTLIPVKTLGGGVTSVDATVCPRHPNGNPNDDPCGGCRDAKKAMKAWTAQAEADREAANASSAAQRDAAIANCPLCDKYGQIDYGNSARQCDHQEAS